MHDDPFQSPEEIIFDANLGEFATKVGFICGLESNGKLSAEEAYQQIKQTTDDVSQLCLQRFLEDKRSGRE